MSLGLSSVQPDRNQLSVGDGGSFAEDSTLQPRKKPIPAGKNIRVQYPVRDLIQLYDSNPNSSQPILLRHHALAGSFNGAASDTDYDYLTIGSLESSSGAEPEVHAQKGMWTLRDIERQGAAMPRATPDGAPVYMAFLARALCGFSRTPRHKNDRKREFRAVAEAAWKNGQIAKLSIFDTVHRAEWLRQDYEIIYELKREGLPIAVEGVVGVSDDCKLTDDQFRSRVRSLLDLDNEIRQRYGFEDSAMVSFALKNTDGRLRGDAETLAEGSIAAYTNILLQEVDGNLTRNGAGPATVRYHTHDIGFADGSVTAFIDTYLQAKTENRLTCCPDMLPGGLGFADMGNVIAALRDYKGWDIRLSPRQRPIVARQSNLLSRATASFQQMMTYRPTHDEEQRFHCAPAAFPSGIRFGAFRHIRALSSELGKGLPLKNGETQADAEARLTQTVIRTWGLLNAASQRMLGETYSITPVANFHNVAAGDMTGRILDMVRAFMKDGVNPLSIDDATWDAIAMENFSAMTQVDAANYLTRADAHVDLAPHVFEHLARLRTSAVLPKEQAKSFFRDIDLEDYASLRAGLLDNAADKASVAEILAQQGVSADLAARFVARYAGEDESDITEGLQEIAPLYKAHINKLLGAGDNYAGWGSEDELSKELFFAAIKYGAQNLEAGNKRLDIIARRPSNVHDNSLWWEGVQPPANASESRVKAVLRDNKVSSFEQLFAANPFAARDMADVYIANPSQFRHDFGLAEALFYRPHAPENAGLISDLRDAYLRKAGIAMAPKNRRGSRDEITAAPLPAPLPGRPQSWRGARRPQRLPAHLLSRPETVEAA